MCEVAVPADAYSPGTYLLVMLTPTWGVSDPRLRAGVGQVAGSGLDERRCDMNTYTVSFALDYLVVSTTIMGMCEEVAPAMARGQIMQDYPDVAPLLEQAFEIDVVLLDSNVLGSGD